MGFENEYDFSLLVNETEKIIIQELGNQLSEYNNDQICMCEDCILDMATLALNSIKPLYRVSLLGSMYASHAMEDPEFSTLVKNSVSIAIEKIRKNPSHD